MDKFERIFPQEMTLERERQLVLALLDCAGVCYDVNFTQDRILGVPVQIIDGVHYSILEQIGKQKNCTYSEIIEYWEGVMPADEAGAFVEFSRIENILARYAAGERVLRHRFRTFDVKGNPMLAQQQIRLYEDCTNGDILGLIYVTNNSENESLRQKEAILSEQYLEASHLVANFQAASTNLPGGYHRCAMAEGYPFLFVSSSFEKLVGYTKQQLAEELDNKFINLILPEDLPRFMQLEDSLSSKGSGDVAYRIRRRDGQIRWIQDSTMLVDWDGTACFQCSIADITDFVNQQEVSAREKAEFERMAQTIPCGYHHCTTDNGFRLEFISQSFMDVVGYSREELLGKPFIDLVEPADRDMFMRHEPQLRNGGSVELVYRIVRKDGSRRWIKDSTMKIIYHGKPTYQCILADITDFVIRQEEIMQRNMDLMRRKALTDAMEANMPSGYHRCKAEEGCPFLYIGQHFLDIVGYTREEIEQDLGNLYSNLIWPEDTDALRTYDEMRSLRGRGNVYDTSVYRIKHKDGSYRWVTDSTMFMDLGEESFFQGIIADITEYMDSLNEARQRAEASSQAKSTFLFNASHDIRTPMNAIQGFAYIIEQNLHDPQIVEDTVHKIQQSADTLMTLMNDVLDLARIEQGKEEIHAQPTDLYEHGKTLYEMFAGEMRDAGIHFYAEGDTLNETVLCDQLKLTRIIMNMLSNAKKFTPAGGTVTFGSCRLRKDADTATYRFFVRDTGIGMSREFQKRAFEQFERERTSTESRVSGSGLGLAIIKKLVDLMGGTVQINSQPGKGTEISATLTLPLVKEETSALPKADASLPDMTGKRILLVEDNDFNREIARYILESFHITVEEAENGAVCLNKLTSAGPGHYDLILMDLQMPIMDGYTATACIRTLEDPSLSRIPIIAMTANAFDEDKQRCLAVGMNGHIGKPFDLQDLLRELSSVL